MPSLLPPPIFSILLTSHSHRLIDFSETALVVATRNNCVTVNITAPPSTAIPAHTIITTVVTNISRRTIIVIEEGHSHVDKVVLAWVIIAALTAFFTIMALIGKCITCGNWKRLCGKMPTRTSKGVQDLELGLWRNEEQNANPGVEVAQSGGHPFINKNMIGSKH
ncbi:hypothetical protein F4801DRAFT_574158 [Xylaria longipes]|nr:hypothetical protein F4801DRAFT_574158 [Xylaria longipes]RYC62782.1 hypothetical protein CHU98_g3418 [Xylaria longipes]